MKCEVIQLHELDDHIVVYLKVLEAKKVKEGEPLTYKYYFDNLKDEVMKVEFSRSN